MHGELTTTQPNDDALLVHETVPILRVALGLVLSMNRRSSAHGSMHVWLKPYARGANRRWRGPRRRFKV
jgi:hypothetical protein